jgi:hypothetical protein
MFDDGVLRRLEGGPQVDRSVVGRDWETGGKPPHSKKDKPKRKTAGLEDSPCATGECARFGKRPLQGQENLKNRPEGRPLQRQT